MKHLQEYIQIQESNDFLSDFIDWLTGKFKKGFDFFKDGVGSQARNFSTDDVCGINAKIKSSKKMSDEEQNFMKSYMGNIYSILPNVEKEGFNIKYLYIDTKEFSGTENGVNGDLPFAGIWFDFVTGNGKKYTSKKNELHIYGIDIVKTCSNTDIMASIVFDKFKQYYKTSGKIKGVKDLNLNNFVIVWKDYGNEQIKKNMLKCGFTHNSEFDKQNKIYFYNQIAEFI